jgi:hypothetical protein
MQLDCLLRAPLLMATVVHQNPPSRIYQPAPAGPSGDHPRASPPHDRRAATLRVRRGAVHRAGAPPQQPIELLFHATPETSPIMTLAQAVEMAKALTAAAENHAPSPRLSRFRWLVMA